MRKRRKKRKKSIYPPFLTLCNSKFARNERIITDAGFDTIDYETALTYFSIYEINSWWEYIIDFSELEEEVSEAWDKLLPDDYFYKVETKDTLSKIHQLISHFDFLPKQVDIATARAVFNEEYQWVQVLTISDKYHGQKCIDNYEAEAIKLGLAMKQELGDEDLVIVNDNKYAVTDVSGHPVYTWGWKHDSIEQTSYILWAGRKTVKVADRLTIKDATRIFGPDDYLEDFWEDEDWE